MNLFVNKFKKENKFFIDSNIKVIFSGRVASPLPLDVQEALYELEELTSHNTGGILNVCLNYGGHSEIVDAVKKIMQDGISVDTINEDVFENYLYQKLPAIDFLVRTGGENRVSNFMLWQLAYAEFYFPEVYFPDFNEEQVNIAFDVYAKRNRRFGGIQDETESC